MKLTNEQIQEYRDNGFLFIPSLFSGEEMDVLKRELPKIYQERRREVVREKDGETIRSVFNMHTYNEHYANLVHHPRIVELVEQLLGSPAYVFQLILNDKQPFGGDQWPWHQDFPTYHNDDGMPEPRAVNVLIFLGEVNEFNGPLMLIPGTHTLELPLPEVNTTKTSYPGRWLPVEYVEDVAKKRGIVAPKGPPGSVIFAHTNIVHGSAPNMSPWRRSLLSLTLNSIENKITESIRPDYVVLRDFTPLEPVNDDCLIAS